MQPRSLIVCVCLLMLGCGQHGPKLAPVSGRVTLNGQPLADVNVTFQPVGSESINPGPGSYGHTDANGRFALSTVDFEREGAVVGNHRVTIATLYDEQDSSEDDVRVLPEKIPAPTMRKARWSSTFLRAAPPRLTFL